MALPANWGPRSLDVDGPLAVVVEPGGHDATNGRFVVLADFEAGTTRNLPSAPAGWRAWDPVISGGRVAWTEWRYEQDGGGPLDWTIRVYDLATGTTREVASGVQREITAGQASWPKLALDEENLAYAIEDSTRPGDRWKVVVVSASGGHATRTIAADRHVYYLGMSGSVIAYSEGSLAPTDGHLEDTRLVLVDGAGSQRVVAPDAFAMDFKDGRLTWGQDSPVVSTGAAQSTRIWTAVAPSFEPQPVGPFPSEGYEVLQEWPATGDGLVSWGSVRVGGGLPENLMGDQLCLWSPGTGIAYEIEGQLGAVLSAIGGGWLAWTDQGDASFGLKGIRIASLPIQP